MNLANLYDQLFHELSQVNYAYVYTCKQADDLRCIYCELKLTDNTLTKDHIVPQSRYRKRFRGDRLGRFEYLNTAPCCQRCNCHKGNKSLRQWQHELQQGTSTLHRVGVILDNISKLLHAHT